MIVKRSFKSGGNTQTHIINEPEVCPMCGAVIKPSLLSSEVCPDNLGANFGVCTFLCLHCYKPFIAHYSLGKDNNDPLFVAPKMTVRRTFEQQISILSPRFVEIYNQALEAETLELDEIAGMGYRKSLEFLIKDFLISKPENQKETIEKMELGNCIANKIDNPKLKALASRAVWIGNDFTHYTRRFDEYDVADLKRFIDNALLWIAAELGADEALAIPPRK